MAKAIRWVVCWLALSAGVAQAAPEFQYFWRRAYYGVYEGQEAILYSDSAFHGKLTFGDLDGDGDLDLLIGKQDGHVNRYENVGSASRPVWRLVAENIMAAVAVKQKGGLAERVSRPIDVGAHAAPALVDLDGDGDLDLVVGGADGKALLFRNAGTEVLAAFEQEPEPFIPANFGTRIVPFFADINSDRSPDLLIGNGQGQVFLLPNVGSRLKGGFCMAFPARDAPPERPPPCRPTPVQVADIAPETNAVPALVDWDRDGDADLFVGKRNGTIVYYENQGSTRAPRWHLAQHRFLAIDNGGFAAPAFVDTNGDGRPELVAGTNSNAVYVYTNKDTGNVLDVWKVTGNLLRVQRLGDEQAQTVITSGDLDGDGDLDLIVGTRGGNLRWIENTGSKTEPAWTLKKANLFPGTPRSKPAPALADLDGDGDLDLLVGGAEGRLWWIQNVGDAKRPDWRLADTNFAGVDVGSDSVPALADLDGDGDLDLLVGNSRGLVIYFRNDGSKQAPRFELVTTRFGGVVVGEDAAPALFDWNQDKLPDLVVGNRAGQLTLTLNRSKDDPSLRTWRLHSRAWGGFQVKGNAVPHFSDFNGDGRPDLIVADGQGNALLWLNAGFEKSGEAEGQAAAAAPAGGGAAPPPVSGAGLQGGATGPLAGAGGAGGANLVQMLSTQEENRGPLPPSYVLASRALGGLKHGGRIVPAFADLDGDGDLDLVVGTDDGKLIYYRNEGPIDKPRWSKVSDAFAGYRHGRNASPLFVDLDRDGELDLVVGSENGRLHFFQGDRVGGQRNFTFRAGALAAVRVRRYASPAVLLQGKAQRPLLLVGEFSGQVVAYALEGEPRALTFKRSHREYLGMDIGVSATPFLGDLDRDGSADLIVGSDQGNLLNFQQIPPNVKNPWGWQKGPGYLEGLTFPAGTTPRLADIDGDGDLDLLLGTEKGTIYFYRNDANALGGATQ